MTGVASPVSSETRRRVAAGVLGNLLGQVINIANQFALVPVFLVFWGKTRYGEWLTLSAAMSYIVLMDVGMQRYSMNLMTGSYARSDERQYIRVLHSSLLWSVMMAGGAIALLAPAFAMAPLAEWFHLHLVGPRVVSAVAILLGCQTALMLPAGYSWRRLHEPGRIPSLDLDQQCAPADGAGGHRRGTRSRGGYGRHRNGTARVHARRDRLAGFRSAAPVPGTAHRVPIRGTSAWRSGSSVRGPCSC